MRHPRKEGDHHAQGHAAHSEDQGWGCWCDLAIAIEQNVFLCEPVENLMVEVFTKGQGEVASE